MTVIRGRRDLLYYPKAHGYLCDRLDLVYDNKRSVVIFSDIFYELAGHGDPCDRFDLVNNPKRSTGH